MWLVYSCRMLAAVKLSKSRRLILGIFILLLVDVIWVVSSELSKFVFSDIEFDKPYFSTYLRSCMLVLYLSGFLLLRTWRHQCKITSATVCDALGEDKSASDKYLSDPVYVPVKYDSRNSSFSDLDDASVSVKKVKQPTVEQDKRSVRFSKLSEVRKLSETQAEDAIFARLSYHAYLRAEEYRARFFSRMNVKQVAKLGLGFCVVYFLGNLCYQEALQQSNTGIVNILSSTSGLFTMVLAAIFPSSGMDKFTLSKLVTVLISMAGVGLVSFSRIQAEKEIPLGALWSLCSALLYAIYLVVLRRKVDNEERLNIPMFCGFLGLFSLLLFWPGFFILHFSRAEMFEWPSDTGWIYLVINGVIGTVLSQLLWLWGCFLTSSLIGTLSLSLTLPLSMIVDVILNKKASYSWSFYAGTAPICLAFIAVSVLSHYENWDPVLIAFKKLLHCICRRKSSVLTLTRLRELDREQTESLISIGTNGSINHGYQD